MSYTASTRSGALTATGAVVSSKARAALAHVLVSTDHAREGSGHRRRVDLHGKAAQPSTQPPPLQRAHASAARVQLSDLTIAINAFKQPIPASKLIIMTTCASPCLPDRALLTRSLRVRRRLHGPGPDRLLRHVRAGAQEDGLS